MPSGETCVSVRWARDYGDKYTLWVALEDPDYNITNGNNKSAWPDTVVSLNWHGDWGHLKPALVGRQLSGNDPNGGSAKRIQATTKFKF